MAAITPAALAAPTGVLKPVTTNDDADLPDGVTRALYVGVAGNIAVTDENGNNATLTSGDAQYHPIRVLRVKSTGTTATGIVALY